MEIASTVLDRARGDIESGRIWKARDRLTAAVKHDPTDQQLLDLLGDVYFEMGDLPAAGRFWILTDRRDSAASAAAEAFEERWGRSLSEKLKMVPFRGQLDAYPPAAQERIGVLLEEADRAGIEWPRPPDPLPEEPDLEDLGMSAGEGLIIVLCAIVGPGLWLLGIAAAIYLLASWLF